MNEDKIAAFKEQIESIHFADALYWKRGKDKSREGQRGPAADKIGQKSGANSHCWIFLHIPERAPGVA